MTSPFFHPNGDIKTFNNDDGATRYECYNSDNCTTSWTYDNPHCTGCHWKGLGVQDVEHGDDHLRQRFIETKIMVASSNKTT